MRGLDGGGRRAAAALACLVAGLAVGAAYACGPSIFTASRTGVAVLVELGPLQPVAQEGEPNTKPVPGAEVTVGPAVGPPLARATTDSAGRATILVPEGRYSVSVASCPGAASLPDPVPVRVHSGSLADVSLVCDTGIR